MAEQVFTNANIWYRGLDLRGTFNQLALQIGQEMLDSTVFQASGATARRMAAGLRTVEMNAAGFSGDLTDLEDSELWSQDDAYVTVVGQDIAAVASPRAYFGRISKSEFTPLSGQSVGDLTGWALSGEQRDPEGFFRGTYLGEYTGTSEEADGGQLGALANATQMVAAIVHGINGSVPADITVQLESDDNASFTSATVRASGTIAAAAAGGAVLLSIDGDTPITDDYWRVTLSAASAFTAVVAIARETNIT